MKNETAVYAFSHAAILSSHRHTRYSPLTQRVLKSKRFRERSQAVAQKLLQGFLTDHSVTRSTMTWMIKSRLGFI